jgi:hypothetical protein
MISADDGTNTTMYQQLKKLVDSSNKAEVDRIIKISVDAYNNTLIAKDNFFKMLQLYNATTTPMPTTTKQPTTTTPQPTFAPFVDDGSDSVIYFWNQYNKARQLFPNLTVTFDNPIAYNLSLPTNSFNAIPTTSNNITYSAIQPNTNDTTEQYINIQNLLLILKSGKKGSNSYVKQDAYDAYNQLYTFKQTYTDVTITSPVNFNVFRDKYIKAIESYPNLNITLDNPTTSYTLSTPLTTTPLTTFAEIYYLPGITVQYVVYPSNDVEDVSFLEQCIEITIILQTKEALLATLFFFIKQTERCAHPFCFSSNAQSCG